MAPHFLALPWDIRRDILHYAIRPDHDYVCSKHHEDEDGLIYPCRGLQRNPTLQLRLTCAQIKSEMNHIDQKGLDLQMCDEQCAEAYLQQHAEVLPLIRSFRFASQFYLTNEDMEKQRQYWTHCYHEAYGLNWEVTLTVRRQKLITARKSGIGRVLPEEERFEQP